MAYLFLGLALLLNAVANVLLKTGAQVAWPERVSVVSLLSSYWPAMLGLVLFAANVIFYFLALRSLPISVAYPVMVAGGFLIINTYAALFFSEQITTLQMLGYGLIVMGVVLVAVSGKLIA